MRGHEGCGRILIAAAASNSGKTTFTSALLKHFLDMDKRVIGFKCGPDYIDPMFHKMITGIECRNLDPFFLDENRMNQVFLKTSKNYDIAVLEGVMGYYDGGESSSISSYEVARRTNTPVILIVNSKGSAISALAVAKGMAEFKNDSNIKGVVFNQMSQSTYETVKKEYEQGNYGFKLLGYIPKLPKQALLESRHLGLITPDEIADFTDKIKLAHDSMLNTVDFDGILEIANCSCELENECESENIYEFASDNTCNIAVARDEAFCFYYDDNLDLLRELGCNITFFSPLKNEPVPENAQGLIIGGGYPENFLDELEKNEVTKVSISNAIDRHMPCIAECGGFMYLNASVDGKKMCKVLKGEVYKTDKLVRFGYVTLKSKSDNLLLAKGDAIKGHEFHYYDSSVNGDELVATKLNGTEYTCVVANEYMYAGFPHLYLLSNEQAAINFVNKCREFKV